MLNLHDREPTEKQRENDDRKENRETTDERQRNDRETTDNQQRNDRETTDKRQRTDRETGVQFPITMLIKYYLHTYLIHLSTYLSNFMGR